MIAQRENFGGTAPSRFLRQVTVVNNSRRQRQRHITAGRTKYATKAQKFYTSDLFLDEEKNILLPSGGHIMRVPGAPSPKDQQCARVITRTFEESWMLPQPDARPTSTRQDYAALESQVLPHLKKPKWHSSDYSQRTSRLSTQNKLRE